MLNRVILIGRLVNDPELKYTPSGVAVSNFRIAVNRPFKREGEDRPEADFIDLVAWRQPAEFAANYLGKGRLVAVEGRLQIRSYQAQDGTRRRVSEVVCDNLKALDRAREPDEGGSLAAPSGGGGGMGGDDTPPYDDPFQDE